MKYHNVLSILLLTLLLLLNNSAFSNIKQYTSRDGLISNNLYTVYKDNEGRLWFGTDRGISVFDGKNFKNYTLQDGIESNDVFQFREDNKGRVWAFTFNGGGCYIQNGKIHNSSNDRFLKQFPHNSYINAFIQLRNSDIYLSYYNGEIFRVHGNQLTKIKSPLNIFTGNTTAFYLQDDSLHLVAGRGIISIIADRGYVKKAPYYQNGFAVRDQLLIADSMGIKILKNGSLTWKYDAPTLTCRNIITLYIDDDDNLLCGCNNELLIINLKTLKKTELLQNTRITSITQDCDGNYWIGTVGNGVYKLNKEFSNFTPVMNLENSRIFYTWNNQIFIANDKVWELKAHALHPIDISLKLSYQPVYNYGNYFFYSDGVYTFLKNKRKQRRIDQEFFLKLCIPADSGAFWLVGTHSIGRLQTSNNDLNLSEKVVFKKRFIAAQYDSAQKLVYCIFGPYLYSFSIENNKLSIIDSFSTALPVGLSYCNQLLILQLNNKSVIVYDTRDYHHRVYTNNDLVFYAFYQLTDTSFLISTDKGYYITGNMRNPNAFTHPQKVEYPVDESNTMFLYPSGNDIFCKINEEGYLFDKKLLNKVLTTPTFFIDKILLNNNDYDPATTVFKNIQRCNLALRLVAPNYRNAKISFQYRIRAKDTTTWFENDGDQLNIYIPGYGTHEIDIRAITENGLSSPIKTLSVDILPPFYQTTIFAILAVTIFLSLLAAIVLLYTRFRKRKFRQELNYMQLEHKAINSLLNPHFVFNAINNIQGVVAENQPGKANEYLAMLSRLIRQNIQNLAFNAIPLSKEIILIENYIKLQNLRYQNRIHLELFNAVVYPEKIFIPPLLIHTFVENSVVHGFDMKNEHFEINIEIEMGADEYLRIYITDNGKGFNPKPANSGDKISMGIEFTRKRLTRISEFYGVKSTLDIVNLAEKGGRGTKVTIVIFSRLGESMTDVLK